MVIRLKAGADWHREHGTKPTASPPLATALVERTVPLPGAVVCTIKAQAEILADGTMGAGTRVEWLLSDHPCPLEEIEPGQFYEAWSAAVEGTWTEAVAMARQSTLESHPAPSRLPPLPA
ncbi:MAG: hypothetical protein ACRC67_14265 [Inquilinus sp.]|uniref:hypothetical protein n=1 Tax=Inquilinus sp. TaxID=1932117 RepID=UPI003F3CD4F8